MASSILGRTECPVRCGHTAAHVKLKTDKATTAYPYVHCRGCGCQLHTKNQEQAEYLLAITRPEALSEPAAAAPAAAPEPVAPTPTVTPTPAPTPRRSGFLFMGGGK